MLRLRSVSRRTCSSAQVRPAAAPPRSHVVSQVDAPALLGRRERAGHQLEHVQRERARRAVRAAGALRPHHVGEADPALLREVRGQQVDVGPRLVAVALDAHRSVEGVRVRAPTASPRCRRPRCCGSGVACTSKLVTSVAIGPDRELDERADVRRHLDVDAAGRAAARSVIGRCAREIRADALTARAGPSSCTSVVR